MTRKLLISLTSLQLLAAVDRLDASSENQTQTIRKNDAVETLIPSRDLVFQLPTTRPANPLLTSSLVFNSECPIQTEVGDLTTNRKPATLTSTELRMMNQKLAHSNIKISFPSTFDIKVIEIPSYDFFAPRKFESCVATLPVPGEMLKYFGDPVINYVAHWTEEFKFQTTYQKTHFDLIDDSKPDLPKRQ